MVSLLPGRAVAIAFSASGFAGFVGAPLLNHILTVNGGNLRQGWQIVAGVSLVGAAVAWLFIKDSPESMGQDVDGVPAGEVTHAGRRGSQLSTACGWTASEAYGTSAYWLILLGAMACQIPFFFNAHAILHMKAHGVSAANAALAMGVFTGTGIVGRFVAASCWSRSRPVSCLS